MPCPGVLAQSTGVSEVGREELHRLLSEADEAIRIGETSRAAVARLADPRARTAGRAIAGARLGDQGQTADILVPGSVAWPSILYAAAELEHAGTGADPLVRAAERVPALTDLRDTARHAAPGVFGRIFSGQRTRRAREAAAELARRLSDPQQRRARSEAARLIERLDRAEELQQAGVHLFPGSHGTPDHLVDAARRLLAAALGQEQASFTQLEHQHIQPVLRLIRELEADPHSETKLRHRAEAKLQALHSERADILLTQLPVEALKTATDSRLRFGGLEQVGISTVADVFRAPASLLVRVNGIGEVTARRMKAAAQTLHREALAGHTTAIGDTPTAAAVALVGVLARFDAINTLDEVERDRRNRLLENLEPLPVSDSLAPWPVVLSHPEHANRPWQRLLDDLTWARVHPESFRPTGLRTEGVAHGMAAWEDYRTRPAHYQGLLVTLLQLEVEGSGDLSGDTVEQIRALKLDKTYLNELHLRGYQSFGARFALVQKKVVLGDDMGLGKTVQALAAAAHLAAETKQAKILVVCPASVLSNWVRETERFTDLNVHRAHGAAKEDAVRSWRSGGGVCICTFDGARTLELGSTDMVIVDEAHLIKNPDTQRSRALADLINTAEYALLMTGTPLENQVSEFSNLVNYVQPDLITDAMATMAAADFRRHIAPAYLRRNQSEVLDELPEKLDQIDWVELTDADQRHYADTVRDGEWMALRRAAWTTPTAEPAKLSRTREILAETRESGHRAVIFTYFRDVLSLLEDELGEQVVGTISGSVPATRRQELVDALGTAAPGSVLLIQITAGGVGLNIQAASVVILAEPQVKPSIEAQAIARVHRMGQVATVQVHRLVADDTAEERMLEMLNQKRKLFDAFARPSESAQVHDAVDVSETELAADIIAQERRRLGYSTQADTTLAQAPGQPGPGNG